MRGWSLVVLFCTALLCKPIQSQDKWSRPEAADKRIDDWVPITASCPSCKQNLEPTEGNGADEIGSLLNPPAVPSGRAFNFNGKQNTNFIRATAGEPYEITTPPATSGQFFSQQQAPKIPQPVHFPVPFFAQQNPFQSRFQQGIPGFQPQFTFIPQSPQIQSLPKENKVTFPESPFIQQQNKGSVQLVYVPIEAIQRQKPRLQSDRPIPQQSQLDVKTQSPFETGKLKFQRPPQPFDQSRFPGPQQLEQEPNRFAPPPPTFDQDAGRFPPPSQLFEQEKPSFTNQLKEQRPEFLPQNEQPVAPQSYQFVEDARNPPSNFFQFHDNRFQKPSFEEQKFKESKPQIQPTFVPQIDESRQESPQNFDGNRPRPDLQQNIPSNFLETRPRQDPPPFQQNFLETRPRQEQRPQNNQPNFQETTFKQEQPPPPPPQSQFIQKFEEPKLEPQPQFIQKFEEPKLEPQPQFIPNFQETRPRQELPPQFVPKLEDPKLVPQQQFISNFQEIPPQQVAQQAFAPNFESLRPNPEVPQNFVPNFQETRPKQESQESFQPNFEEVKFKPKPKAPLQSSTPPPASQETFNSPSSTGQVVQATSTPYPPAHQPPLSVYMEKRLDNRINEVLTILKDAKTIPVLDTIGNRSPKVFVGPSDLNAPRGYVKFDLPYLSSLDITKIDSMVDRLPFFVAPLNFKPPFGYAKIPFPPPHIGSVVVSSKSPAVATSTEFAPFALTSQLPTEVNSLQPAVSSTTQRGTEKVQPSTDLTTPTPKRNRQRKPLHRGSLTSFSTTTPVNDITERQRDQFTTPAELQRLPENSPSVNEHISSTPTPSRHAFTRRPVEQQAAFETTQAPIQQQQQNFDNPPQQQFFSNEQIPQTQQDYLDTLPQLTQQQFFNNQQQPNQQPFFENQQQFLENSPQTVQEQITSNPQSFVEVNNQDTNQQQFISSSTEKQIFKNFQQVQPLSQYQVNNNFLNQQQSSTEQVQSASNPPQTVSNEPETVVTISPPEVPKLRQRLSYYDKLLLTSTQVPAAEITSAQNAVETSEKPRERPKLRPRQRLTTTRRPTTEQSSAANEVSEHVTTETSTQRYNPLKRRRPVTTTTTTAEPTETTRSLLRSRTTQASRSEFVRSRSRRPSTTSTTTTTEATRVQQYEDAAKNDNDDVQTTGLQQDEQKKIDEAASFWNEPVTVQQSHGYELDVTTSHQHAYTPDGKFNSAEPPADGDFSKEKFGGEPKKAHDPNGEKKPPGRRGHWVRVRVKKPQDSLDTAESQNSLGPLSANAIRELATKPTTEFDYSPSSPATSASISTTTSVDLESVAASESMTTTTTTTTTPESASTSVSSATTSTTTTTTAAPPTTVFDYITEGLTEERAVETTIAPPSAAPPSAKTYPDDEQDEAFQRNLADMLAKFIGGDGNSQSQETAVTETVVDESTAEMQYDAEPTVTPSVAAVTDVPVAPVTSTTTKVSMETEICYKGRCVKSKKNKQITDLVSEP